MNKFLLILFSLVLIVACAVEKTTNVSVELEFDEKERGSSRANPTFVKATKDDYRLVGSASLVNAPSRDIQFELPTLTPELRQALHNQRKLLKRQRGSKTYEIGGRTLTKADFIRVIDDLLSGKYLEQPLSIVPVSAQAKVLFTGYYSPEVNVRRNKTSTYRYPILAYPTEFTGALPSRKEIEQGKKLGFDSLAIAWARHPLDVYTLQLQGSGFIKFEDGSQHYLAYGGTNRYPYQSIGLALQQLDPSVTDISLRGLRKWIDEKPLERDTITSFNPNYGFFKLSAGEAKGAAGVDLVEMVSVAADPNHYPLGSVLLAKLPDEHNPSKLTTRILLVQDTGGAINGNNRLDLYTGVGEAALSIAERTKKDGEVYLLSPR